MSDTNNPILPGQERRFDYLFAGSDLMADYNARHGQIVTVVRQLVAGEEYDDEGDAMFMVRFEDGFEGHAWEFELAPIEQ